MADQTGDTLTDIHTAVGELLHATDVPETGADADVDATIDAELDAKAAGEEIEEPTEEVAEPTDEAPAEEAAPDPFASALEKAEPFRYTVDGQQKTYDGIKVVMGADGKPERAIVPADAFSDLQYRLQRGEYLEAQDKARHQKLAQYEAVEFTAPDGQKHTGLAAVEQYAIENAKLAAGIQVLARTLEDQEAVTRLAIAYQNGDQSEIRLLTRELGLAAKDASWAKREQWQKTVQSRTQQESESTNREQVVRDSITGSVQHWASQHPTLTQDDIAKAIAHFTKIGTAIVRPATPDEAKAAGVRPGDLVIDHPVIAEWLADRAALRESAVKASQAAEQAARENAARLAARKAPTPPKQATKPSAKVTVPDDEGETWAQQKARLQSGQFRDLDE